MIAAVYSASGVLGTEYDLKVMNLLRSTEAGAERIIFKRLACHSNYSGGSLLLVKIPAILKVVGE